MCQSTVDDAGGRALPRDHHRPLLSVSPSISSSVSRVAAEFILGPAKGRARTRQRRMAAGRTRNGTQIADSVQAYWYLPYSVLVTPLRVVAGKLSGAVTTVTLRTFVSPAFSSPAWTAAAPMIESPL